ncbi:cytochrome P450, partial [Lichtheimia hyalospora FSU 10163]
MIGVAAAATISVLALKYHNRAIFYEPPDDIPMIEGHPLIGTLLSQIMNKDRSHDVDCEAFERLNTLTFSASAAGLRPAVITINPLNIEYFLKTNFANYVKGADLVDALGHMLGTGIFVSNGEHWRIARKAASHVFNVVNFRDHFTDVFIKELNIMCDGPLDEKAQSGEPIDFHETMFKFTLDTFVMIAFNVQLNTLSARGTIDFAEAFDRCQDDCLDRLINPFMPIVEAIKSIIPGQKTIKQHLDVINNLVYGIIQERKQRLANGEKFKDLLSRFMDTHNEDGNPLSDKELRDTVINFLLAGRDTTAQALSWTFYNLMLHPRIEKKLRDEITANIRDEHESDSRALYEIVKHMPYAHAVLYEVLRLHPPVPGNVKVALEDDIWPDGTRIRKGDAVCWSPYAQGRSTEIWGPDAKQLKPERWINEQGELHPCIIGQNLATLEAIVAIIFMLRRYKFTLVPGQDITYRTGLTMPMKNGMQVFVEK